MSRDKNFLFRQIPIYEANETFVITSVEFAAMIKMAELASEYMPVFETLISRQIELNKVQVKYEDSTGKRLTKKQIEKILKNAAEEISNPLPPESLNIEPEL